MPNKNRRSRNWLGMEKQDITQTFRTRLVDWQDDLLFPSEVSIYLASNENEEDNYN